jgi:hypothetical protein
MSLQVVQSKLGELYNSVGELSEQEKERRELDPFPNEFIGFVRDYRYRSGAMDEFPKHTMRIVVDDSMVLWLSTDTTTFEKNILRYMDVGTKMGKLNGKLMMVRRVDGRLVPVKIMPEPFMKGNGKYVCDKYGRVLFDGARVYDVQRRADGVVNRLNGTGEDPTIRVKCDDETETNRYARNLIRLV